MASIHLIFKEDSEISSFLFLFGGIIVSGSDVMSLKDWIQESNNIVFLVVLECLQKVTFQIFVVTMDYIKEVSISG